MNILISIFREIDGATGRMVRNAVTETVKAGRRILVKAHRRKGKSVKAHRRTVKKVIRHGAKTNTTRQPRQNARRQRHAR
jgi:heterodisulfide reductase subunit C